MNARRLKAQKRHTSTFAERAQAFCDAYLDFKPTNNCIVCGDFMINSALDTDICSIDCALNHSINRAFSTALHEERGF